MTTPRRELVWIDDVSGLGAGAVRPVELWHDERLDQSEELRFEIPATDAKSYLLAADRGLRWRDRRFRVVELEDNRDGARVMTTVVAEAEWYALGGLVYVGSFVLTDSSAKDGLEAILDGTGWTVGVGTSAAAAPIYSFEAQDQSRLSLLRSWARVTNLDLVFDTAGRTVDLVASRGVERGLAFRYRRNLRSVRRRVRPPEATVLFPYGADGLTVAGVNGGVPYVEDFTYYTDQGITLAEARRLYTRSRVWSDTSFLVDTALLVAAEERLAELSQPTVSYELDVVDLSELTGMREAVRPGDRVRVSDPDFGDDLRATVVRTKRYPLTPWRDEVELSFLPSLVPDGSTPYRPATSEDWHLFVGPTLADIQIRNDGTWITNRIPLRFREGGQAHYSLDLHAVGVGAGTMHVEVYDADDAATVFRTVDVAYTNGAVVRAALSWAATELVGAHDYRVRVSTTASGGPSSTNGVNVTKDATGEASFFVMAQGAVQETPVADNSITFDYTGAVQTFTVPDGITEVTIEASGSRGGGAGGAGGRVTATFEVVPATVYDVYVGGFDVSERISWPDGGSGGGGVGTDGFAGGGSTSLRPTGTAFASSIIVAGGGGGSNAPGASRPASAAKGGDGGFYAGTAGYGYADTTPGSNYAGLGASQYAGGAGGSNGGGAGSFGQGGSSPSSGNAFAFEGGGGGGGWYGGGGAGLPVLFGGGFFAGDGGGGSGYLAAGAYDVIVEDGAHSDRGQVVISWDDPVEV